MFWTNLAIALICFFIAYTFYLEAWYYVFFGLLAYSAAFEFGPGPIAWLYISEVTQDKASSIATALNWFTGATIA